MIGAIGFHKVPKGTTRGVFGVDKQGKVLLRQAGGPDATVNAMQKLLAADPTEETPRDGPEETTSRARMEIVVNDFSIVSQNHELFAMALCETRISQWYLIVLCIDERIDSWNTGSRITSCMTIST